MPKFVRNKEPNQNGLYMSGYAMSYPRYLDFPGFIET